MYKSEPFFDFRYQKGFEFCANFDFIDKLKSRKVGVYDSIAVFQKLFAKALICFRFFLWIESKTIAYL